LHEFLTGADNDNDNQITYVTNAKANCYKTKRYLLLVRCPALFAVIFSYTCTYRIYIFINIYAYIYINRYIDYKKKTIMIWFASYLI